MSIYPGYINLKCIISLILILLLISCKQEKELQTFQLTFHASANNSSIDCSQAFQLSDQGNFYINDFRFYVSDISLTNQQQQEIPVQLIQDKLWQFQSTALVDFEDASAYCEGTHKTNTIIKGLIPTGNYHQLTFTIGVPFLLNHQNPAFTQSPLNIGSMFWSWQSGYKFFRLDLQNDQSEKWAFHLGSTGCQSSASIRAPEQACLRPNLIKITFPALDLSINNRRKTNIPVTIKLGRLLKELSLNKNTRCLSSVDNKSCSELFKRLGLNLQTGQCNKQCQQQIFTLKTD